jgi:DNA-binding GntR family transcriptional regulator
MPNRTKSKKTIVYENLKRKIITNALKPGDPLIEGVLSKELKTSKTPIREALQQLEKDGLVENIPGKGAFVSRFTFQDIRELYEIREILECEITRQVAAKGDFDLAEAQAIRDKFLESETNGGRTGKGYFSAGDYIHSFIFAAWGNQKLIQEYQRLQEQFIRISLHFFNQSRPQERAVQSTKEHLEIIDSLIARDPIRVEKAIRTHFQNSLEFLKSVL